MQRQEVVALVSQEPDSIENSEGAQLAPEDEANNSEKEDPVNQSGETTEELIKKDEEAVDSAEQHAAQQSAEDVDRKALNKRIFVPTKIYLKKGSLLHAASEENKVNVRAAVTRLKELTEKRKQKPGKGLKKTIGNAIYEITNHQGSYFHKTGRIPEELNAEAHKELTNVAHEVKTSTGDEDKGVPTSAMSVYRKALIESTVAVATHKVAELRHKKAVAKKLKEEGVQAEGKQLVLKASVKAAERAMKLVLQKTNPATPEPTEQTENESEPENEPEEETPASPEKNAAIAKLKALTEGTESTEKKEEEEDTEVTSEPENTTHQNEEEDWPSTKDKEEDDDEDADASHADATPENDNDSSVAPKDENFDKPVVMPN